MNIAEDIFQYVLTLYPQKDFQPLACQFENWRKTRPFEGLKILDATPIFKNTFPKYAALLAGGATLLTGSCPTIPKSAEALKKLAEFGIAPAEKSANNFDAVLDCGAAFKNTNSRLGYVELTRTGALRYANFNRPVYVADDGKVKQFETVLGTGDGFARAMDKLGYQSFCSKNILLFGCGKVGRGIAKACLERGANLFVVDDFSRVKIPFGASAIDLKDIPAIRECAKSAWCVVTATGVPSALKNIIDSDTAKSSGAIFANMGVEDEFGENIESSRVLNNKRPLNFILDEPTHLKFIAPTLALHNLGLLKLAEGSLKNGLNKPSQADESAIFAQIPDLVKELHSTL